MKIKLIFGIFSGCILALCLVGCSPKRPTPQQLQNATAKWVSTESEGRIKLVDFKTKDSEPRSGTVEGEFYWDYEGQIEFVEDCKWLLDKGTETMHVTFKTALTKSGAGDTPTGTPMRQGDTRRITGSIFVEKVKGEWKPTGMILLSEHPL